MTKIQLGLAVLGTAAVGTTATIIATTGGSTSQDVATVRFIWNASTMPAGKTATYEWQLQYRFRNYSQGGWEPSAYGLISAGSTTDTVMSVTFDRPHPLDSMFVIPRVRVLEKKGKHGLFITWSEILVPGMADSIALYEAISPLRRFVSDSLKVGQSRQYCASVFKADTMYVTTCPMGPSAAGIVLVRYVP